MAVAIAALGIVSIMGLMPQGLETSRKTSNMAAESRIMQEIIGDLESADWSNLETYVSATSIRSYDDQGIQVTGGNVLVSYVAKLQISSDSYIPQSGSVAAPYLRRLVVKIASSPRTNFDFGDTNSARYKTISYLLPKIQ